MANLPADSSTAGAMPRSRVVSYAMGDVANNVSFQMTSLFLMAYMTDIAGVSCRRGGHDLRGHQGLGRRHRPGGRQHRRTRETKWGRLRPWIVGVSPFLSISVVLLFSTPAGLSPMAAVAWILLFDAAFQLCYSFVNIPYGSLSAAMTENATDRSRLAGARSIASSVTGVLLAFVLAPQFQDTAADNIRLSFTIATILLSAVALVLYWICFLGTKEVVPPGAGKLTLSTTLKMVRKNKPLLVLCFGALFLLGASFTMNAVMMYYARDVLGSASNFTWLYLAQTIGTIGIASMVPAITVRFGKRIGYVALASVAVVGFVLIAIVPPPAAAAFGPSRFPRLRRRIRRHERFDVLDAGRHRRLRRVEDGDACRGRQLLHLVVHPEVRPGPWRLRRRRRHRCLRVRGGGAGPVDRGDPGHQGRGRVGSGRALHHRRAGAPLLSAGGRSAPGDRRRAPRSSRQARVRRGDRPRTTPCR